MCCKSNQAVRGCLWTGRAVFLALIVSLGGCGGGDKNTSDTADTNPPSTLPNDPVNSAPPLELSKPTPLFAATSFLFSGEDPVQTGVADGAIAEERIVVLRGKVVDDDSTDLPGVTISVLNQPQYGQTLTRADGMFDLAVNGGGPVTLQYRKQGYITAQRQVQTPWQDYVWAPDVIMTAYDTQVNKVTVNAPAMQVARGGVSTDADGERQATILVPPATTATMILPDGSEQDLTSLDMRLTEFTVGENGREKMPAALPPSSAYTYAAEFSIDQAVDAGAEEVKFNQPLPVYVDNFLDFPVGTPVPLGYYDRKQGRWVAADSGLVIKVLSVDGGSATLDLDGDDIADDATGIGVNSDELQHIASLYGAGQTLWRVQISHFSAWDMNWGFGPPGDARDPRLRHGSSGDVNNKRCGSIIGCENQNLGEAIAITGTPFTLHYNSEQVAKWPNILDIPLTDGDIPASLKGVVLEIGVAGRNVRKTFAPQTDLSYRFEFDGKDAYGRRVVGRQRTRIRVGYTYDGVYERTERFGYNGNGVAISGDRQRTQVTLWEEYDTEVGSLRHAPMNLPGWSLDVQHALAPQNRELLLGNGDHHVASRPPIQTIAGNGLNDASGDGGLATDASIGFVKSVAVAADGSIYFSAGHIIRRISPSGVISTYGGKTWTNSLDAQAAGLGDGGPAIDANLDPWDLAMGSDGSLYFSDKLNYRIRRITPDGVIGTVAGAGLVWNETHTTTISSGDGGPAAQASFKSVDDVAVAPDGTVYVVDFMRIRRVGTDGIITTLLGNDLEPTGAEGCDDQSGGIDPKYLEVDGDGNLYYALQTGYFNTGFVRILCKLTPGGVITHIAGYYPNSGGLSPTTGVAAAEARFEGIYGLAIGPDGSVYFTSVTHHRVFRIDEQGNLVTVAGFESAYEPSKNMSGFGGDGSSAKDALLSGPRAIAVSADNRLIIADAGNYRIRAVEARTPLFDSGDDADINVASSDGREVYVFDANGKHLRTREAFTGAVRYAFDYDAEDHLTGITDAAGNVTQIERASGVPTAIVAPGGQRTTLTTDANNNLLSVTNPAAEAYTLSYSGENLLTSFVTSGGGEHRFEYDADGRLTKDSDPDGGSVTLQRTLLSNGMTVTVTTSEGLVHSYTVERLGGDTLRSTVTDAAGASLVRIIRGNGDEEITYPTGSTGLIEYAADPRWGSSAAYPRRIAITTLGNRKRTITRERSVSLADLNDPWSMTAFQETKTENNLTRTVSYDAATRKIMITSREGREFSEMLDELGRPQSYQPDMAIDPVERSYDAAGHLASQIQGTSSKTFDYDALNRLVKLTNSDGGHTDYQYDDADRLTKLTLPSGRAYGFAYDADGNNTQITMPNGKTHALVYSANGREQKYTPPGSTAGLLWDYDSDGAWTGSTFMSGATLDADYDTGGRPVGRSYADAEVIYGYAANDNTARVRTISNTPTGADKAQTIALDYDAELVTAMNWTGVAIGNFTYSYDNRSLMSNIQLVSGTTTNIAFTRDKDGMVTKQGPFTFTRNGPMGGVSRINDAKLSLDVAYNSTGYFAQRSMNVNGSDLYAETLSYDDSRRITRRVETVNGATATIDYGYDADGQLTSVKRDNVVTESYSYDDNGNRDSGSAAYDDQDRLTSLGGVDYGHDTDGYLQQRGADTFTYSARSELLTASVSGTSVTYRYDGLGRRISRTVGAEVTQYMYGNPYNPLQITAARSPANVLNVYHYDQNGVLFAIQQGTVYYYVASDVRGTPRLVADANGTVVKTLEYDSYGRSLIDSAPAFFLPIGFGGGLSDDVTGLVRMGYRDYDPASGRWMSRDPALYHGRQFNLYTYAGNDPINRNDPSGLFGIGGSAYDGIGGGARIVIDSTGFKICGELGVGIGAGIEGDPFEEVGDVATSPKLVGEVGLGPVGAGVEFGGHGDCISLGESIKLGPYKAKFEGADARFAGGDVNNFDFDLNAEAKLAFQFCGGMKL